MDLARHGYADKAPAKQGMDLYSERVCPMARGRNGAQKKPETSSSMDKGWAKGIYTRACSGVPFPERKNGI